MNPLELLVGLVVDVVLLVGGALIYFLPMIVVARRRRQNPAPIAIVNIFLGWTFIGWVVALAWAASGPSGAPTTAPAPPT